MIFYGYLIIIDNTYQTFYMALRNLVRRPFVLKNTVRGGHGWDRPDVPLTQSYIHKRAVLYK